MWQPFFKNYQRALLWKIWKQVCFLRRLSRAYLRLRVKVVAKVDFILIRIIRCYTMQWRSACNVPVWVTMSSQSHPVLRYALKHVNFLEVSSPHKKPRTQFSPSTTATKNTRYQLTQRHATPFQLSRARPGSTGIMWLYGDIYSSTRLWVVGWDDGASLFSHLVIDFPIWLRTYTFMLCTFVGKLHQHQ